MSVPKPPFTLTWTQRLGKLVEGVRWMTSRSVLGFVNVWKWLSVMIAILDDGQNRLFQAFYARLPGLGTPTALSLIGQSRGLIRGIGESDADYSLYLQQWLQLWETAGNGLALCKAVQHYIGGGKMIRLFTRRGKMIQLNADGTVVRAYGVAWDWDSKSNPEKATHWSEMWLVIYSPPWARAPNLHTGRLLGSAFGIGVLMPRSDWDALKSIFADWKADRSRLNTVVICYDATLFDPAFPAKMPDGWFGKWGKPDPAAPGSRIQSRFADGRYWHPNSYRHDGDTRS